MNTGNVSDGRPGATSTIVHFPPDVRWRLPLLLGPTLLASVGWPLGAWLSGGWTWEDHMAASTAVLASPIVGAMLWTLAPWRRFRRSRLRSPVDEGGCHAWCRSDGDGWSILTRDPERPSLLVEGDPAPDIGRPMLRLQCLSGADGPGLLVNGFVISQVLAIAALLASSRATISLLVVWPFTLVWTLMPIAWMGFGNSPWRTLVFDAGGAHLETTAHYLFFSTSRSSPVQEIAREEGGLALMLAVEKDRPGGRVVVRFPGGSVEQDVQERLALQARPTVLGGAPGAAEGA